MKLSTVLLMILFTGLECCQSRVDDYQSVGLITGSDPRMCICCGGWQIVIDSETYNFDSLPADANIDLHGERFPIPVKLDWKIKSNSGCNKWIIVQRIIKSNIP